MMLQKIRMLSFPGRSRCIRLLCILLVIAFLLTTNIFNYSQWFSSKEQPTEGEEIVIEPPKNAKVLKNNAFPNLQSRLLQNIQIGGCPPDLGLLVLITTQPRHHEMRDVIRRTWAMTSWTLPAEVQAKFRTIVLFIMGTDPDPMWETLINEEAKIQGDIIQFDLMEGTESDVIDKVTSLFWVQNYCSSFSHTPRYILKVQDRSFVNVPSLVRRLRDKRQSEVIIMGKKTLSLMGTIAETYPYLRQSSYIMSGDLVPQVELSDFMTQNDHSNTLFNKQNNVDNWTCNVTDRLACSLSTEQCFLAADLKTDEIDNLWSRVTFSKDFINC